jgi:uncharacterized repeat protein (TIGR03843 family)
VTELARSEVLEVLARGELEVQGRMPWSSNSTFLVTAELGGATLGAVYKPGRGERPLWDFPGGLYRREVAAFQLSEALGLGLVPETILRHDAPFGSGSLQRFVDADFSEHYFTLLENPAHHPRLRELGAFDLLLNNADRKSGHCLWGEDRIWGIDNGLSFHEEPKLRTVIWDFAGEELPPHLLPAVAELAEEVPTALTELLEPDEVLALGLRALQVLEHPLFPAPRDDHRAYPWPLV